MSGEHRREISGGVRETTNNRMELTAAIQALRALTKRSEVDLYTDSAYLKKGVTEWLDSWKRNSWCRKSGKRFIPVKNDDLWRELDELVSKHLIAFHWVEGHAGNKENERCDYLARQSIPRRGS